MEFNIIEQIKMKPEKVLQHIDNQIIEQIESGCDWSDITKRLKEKSNRYKKRDAFIPVSERYLINNWERIDWKKRLTSMMVLQLLRRIDDVNWITKNLEKFPQFESIQMYKMILLKDKLKYNKVI